MESRAFLSTSPPPSLLFSRNLVEIPSKPYLKFKHVRCSTSGLRKNPKFAQRNAFPDSLPIHTKNPRAVYKDIRRLAQLGRLQEALSVLDYLERSGIPVNTTTFAALLSSCARVRALDFGRKVHARLCSNGFDRNEFLLTKLVQMYAACGSPEEAKKVLSELAPKSVYPWNALLRGNVSDGLRWSDGPVNVFSEMQEMEVDTNEFTFSCLIKSFAGSPALFLGAKTHALLIKKGFLSSSVLLQTSLIDMYFKCSKIQMAMKVFDEITERDIVVWGAVISGFAHNKLRKEALCYLRWMLSEGIEPNSVIITSILPVIGELSERNLGREVHALVLKKFKFYQSMISIHSGLIDMYCKCGDMVSGRLVFCGCEKKNAVSWTALMSGYASNDQLDQALRSIISMQQGGVKPDVVSLATALPVCSKLKALKPGKEIHAYALKHLFLPNVSISTSLMTMYAICGELKYSCRVFDSMKKKNIMAWTAFIESYLKNGYPYEALDAFRSLLLANQRPDSVVIARILNTSAEIGALRLGKEIHSQVLKMKLESIPIVISEVVRMYGGCRDVEKAKKVFDRVQSKGSLTCTAIIDAYGFNGQNREALHLFDWMEVNGFIPNHFTFVSLLRICERGNMHDEALRIFDTMVQKYKVAASKEHYDCIINLLTRVSRINEAQKFIYWRSMLLQLSRQ